MSSWEPWLALGLIVAGLVLVRFWRSAEARAATLQFEVETLESRREKLEAGLAKETQARRRQAEELATLRKKADKVKRRQTRTPDQPLGTAQRIRDHQDQVERLERERDRITHERDAQAEEILRLEARLAKTDRELEAALAPPEVSDSPEVAEATGEQDELEMLRADLARRTAETEELSQALDGMREADARLRKRMQNQEQLYASLRAELEVKKDRLRTQEEQLQRLQALKVAVVD